MVAEPWIVKMGNQVSANLQHALLLEHSKKQKLVKPDAITDSKKMIGIISFEIANLMSKVIHLHRSLTDSEISKLKNEIFISDGVRKLVSTDEVHLLNLAMAEKVNDLNRVASIVSRLGKRCSEPALQRFEHVYSDIVTGAIDAKELGILVKDMNRMVRKMEKYVNLTTNLYAEMENQNELEREIKKVQYSQNEEIEKVYKQKLLWQKQDVIHLKEVSLWNQTYDKIVELLARTVCTVYARISLAFGNSALKDEDDYHIHQSSHVSGHSTQGKPTNSSSPSTVGGSALALHYANIIIVIEKLLCYPHLVGDEARDDLYQMLPTSLRKSLRCHLNSCMQNSAIYDAPLAHEWREKLDGILRWLSPMAHNTTRWQCESSFEQHRVVSQTNVVLLQTLHFADKERTEAAICQLLVGLTYICQYEHRQNALLDCASSFDLEDCMDWQVQCKSFVS